jgi:hypothetical protein
MLASHRRVVGVIRLTLFVSALLFSGCGDTISLESAGVSGLRPSSGWKSVAPGRYVVPGRAIAAWSGPDGSSLVVFTTLSGPKVGAEGLLKEIRMRFENLPELRIVEASKRIVGGVESAYFEVIAPGTGDELAPTGLGKPIALQGKTLIATRRISLGIPGQTRNLWLTWHAPDNSATSLKAEVASATRDMIVQERPQSSY